MPSITYLDAEAELDDIVEAVQQADNQVSSAVKRFVVQVDVLAAMDTVGSSQQLLLQQIIDTSELPENKDNAAWSALRERCLLVRSGVTERATKYKAALPTVITLRG